MTQLLVMWRLMYGLRLICSIVVLAPILRVNFAFQGHGCTRNAGLQNVAAISGDAHISLWLQICSLNRAKLRGPSVEGLLIGVHFTAINSRLARRCGLHSLGQSSPWLDDT